MIKQTPMSARTGENDVGFNSCTKKFPLSIPVRLKSQDVTVVPIFAPMMMPTAWVSFIIPEFTKPTTMTVVADDDWMIAVTPAPKRTALIGFDVSFSRILSSLPPESFFETFPHSLHSVKEQREPAKHRQYTKKIHKFPLFKFINILFISFLPCIRISGECKMLVGSM